MSRWRFLLSKTSLVDGDKTKEDQRIFTPLRRESVGSLPSRSRSSMSNLQGACEEREPTFGSQEELVQEQRRKIQAMEEEEKSLHRQVWALSDELNGSKEATDTVQSSFNTLKTSYEMQQRNKATVEEENRDLSQQLREARSQIEVLTTACNEKDKELSTISESVKKLSRNNQKLQSRIIRFEGIIAPTDQETEQNLRRLFDHCSKLEKDRDEIVPRLQASEDLSSKLSQDIQNMESENASLRTVINELERETSCAKVSQPQTLRSFLTMLVFEFRCGLPIHQLDDDNIQTVELAQNWPPRELSENSLDKVCDPDEIQCFAKSLPRGPSYNLFFEHLQVGACTVCSKPKFWVTTRTPSRQAPVQWPCEYPSQSRFFSCCYKRVCKECFKTHLLETVEFGWWHRLGNLQWLSCPREGCSDYLGIRCEADLQICLEQNCGVDAERSVKMYVKALALRQALEKLDPKLAEDVLLRAATLSRHLISVNRMYSPFDPRFDSALVDETGCIPEFNPGTIFKGAMDDEPSMIPIFLKFLRRQEIPKTCIVCSKTLFEVNYGDLDAWKSACCNFKGPWMWNILVFPTREILHCDHEFEVCRACIAEHLRSTITSEGPSACESLSCPQCRRKLSYQEVHQLADVETIAKYEKFLFQTFLAKQPNFRWCLSPLCQSGQLYEDDMINEQIFCDECLFAMCFKHQVPWHNELSCDEYDSQKAHGDPSFAQTREWIRTNTKPCPGCEAGIQKGEACFHMTCSQCKFEFCWQCLAPWTDIRERGQEAHNESCYFRTNSISPMGITGETLEDALRAMNN